MTYTATINGVKVTAEVQTFSSMVQSEYQHWPVIRWSFPNMLVETRCHVFARFDQKQAIEYGGKFLAALGFREE